MRDVSICYNDSDALEVAKRVSSQTGCLTTAVVSFEMPRGWKTCISRARRIEVIDYDRGSEAVLWDPSKHHQ